MRAALPTPRCQPVPRGAGRASAREACFLPLPVARLRLLDVAQRDGGRAAVRSFCYLHLPFAGKVTLTAADATFCDVSLYTLSSTRRSWRPRSARMLADLRIPGHSASDTAAQQIAQDAGAVLIEDAALAMGQTRGRGIRPLALVCLMGPASRCRRAAGLCAAATPPPIRRRVDDCRR